MQIKRKRKGWILLLIRIKRNRSDETLCYDTPFPFIQQIICELLSVPWNAESGALLHSSGSADLKTVQSGSVLAHRYYFILKIIV